MGEWDHLTGIVSVCWYLEHEENSCAQQEKEPTHHRCTLVLTVLRHARRRGDVCILKSVSKPSVVKKTPSEIINHCRCLQAYKPGVVENFHVSLHIFLQRNGRRENSPFVSQTWHFLVCAMHFIVSEEFSAEFASIAVPLEMQS